MDLLMLAVDRGDKPPAVSGGQHHRIFPAAKPTVTVNGDFIGETGCRR